MKRVRVRHQKAWKPLTRRELHARFFGK